jgi:hypothetical protein
MKIISSEYWLQISNQTAMFELLTNDSHIDLQILKSKKDFYFQIQGYVCYFILSCY